MDFKEHRPIDMAVIILSHSAGNIHRQLFDPLFSTPCHAYSNTFSTLTVFGGGSFVFNTGVNILKGLGIIAVKYTECLLITLDYFCRGKRRQFPTIFKSNRYLTLT